MKKKQNDIDTSTSCFRCGKKSNSVRDKTLINAIGTKQWFCKDCAKFVFKDYEEVK